MQQGGGVDELDDGRRFDVLLATVAAGARCEHDREGAQALAAAADDVLGHLVHERDVARELAFDDRIHAAQVVLDQDPDLFQVHVWSGDGVQPRDGTQQVKPRESRKRPKCLIQAGSIRIIPRLFCRARPGPRWSFRHMYAVIATGGKQYRVAEGDVVRIEKLSAEPGGDVEFDKVLLVGQGTDVKVGTPFISGGKVTATVQAHGKGDKKVIVKFRRRKHYLRQGTHRQPYTDLKITGIVGA